VDALIGRFVLMHQGNPAQTLRAAAGYVRRGGLVAFLESHMSALVAAVHSCPHSQTYDRILRWLVDVLRAAGAHTDMTWGFGFGRSLPTRVSRHLGSGFKRESRADPMLPSIAI
jgi:hypothetical protein